MTPSWYGTSLIPCLPGRWRWNRLANKRAQLLRPDQWGHWLWHILLLHQCNHPHKWLSSYKCNLSLHCGTLVDHVTKLCWSCDQIEIAQSLNASEAMCIVLLYVCVCVCRVGIPVIAVSSTFSSLCLHVYIISFFTSVHVLMLYKLHTLPEHSNSLFFFFATFRCIEQFFTILSSNSRFFIYNMLWNACTLTCELHFWFFPACTFNI